LQTPGPTNIPDRVLRAMDRNAINHRGPEFGALGLRVIGKLRKVFKTESDIIGIFPSSGTGAWESALVNTLSPGDRVLIGRTGQFAHLWEQMAAKLGMDVQAIDTDWRRGTDPAAIAAILKEDREHRIKAVCVVHSETSTSCMTDIGAVRAAIDAAGHPAMLMVDAISSLACADYRHDEWKVDVTIAGSQKGLMVPPGLSFAAISAKALERATQGTRRSYWDWAPLVTANKTGFFPYTPAINLLFSLDAALDMLLEEGLANVFARHDRYAEATRRTVRHWGLELQCEDPRAYAPGVTAIRVPDGHNADALRTVILDKYNMSLGNGLGRIDGKVFRIGHMGDLSPLQLMGVLSGVEMGLRVAGVPHKSGGTQAALEYLSGNK